MISTDNTKKLGLSKVIISLSLSTIFIIIIVFLSAGRLTFWQGWVYSVLSALVLLMTVAMLYDQPDLISERLKPGKGMKRWDKIYYAFSSPFFFLSIILACVDVGRFGWSPPLPISVYIISCIIYVLGHSIFLWAKRTNKFFSSVVRIQTERNQVVCQEGPYRFVRHPGYVGGIIFTLTTPLVLGALWAFVPAGIAVSSMVVRTYLEDKTLQKELPGYVDYTKKVRYRLIPGIW